MMLTVEAVVDELEAARRPRRPMAEVCAAVAHGSLMGARGNSGVILSQLLRGVSSSRSSPLRPSVAAGGGRGAGRGRRAGPQGRGTPGRGHDPHGRPRRAARAPRPAAPTERRACARTLEAAREAAQRALDATPSMLPALAQAGVVDAGGAGLPAPARRAPLRPRRAGAARAAAVTLDAGAGRCAPAPSACRRRTATRAGCATRSCTSSHAPDDTIADFKEVWAGIGDSIVVVGGDGHLELPHPHRRHRRRHRGRPRLRPAAQHPGHRPGRADRRGALGPRARRPASEGDERRRRAADHRRGRGGDRRRHRADLPLARGAPPGPGRPVDEPLDGRDPRGRRRAGVRAGRDPPQQQEHPAGGRAGRRAHRPSRCGSSRPSRSSRASPRCSPTTRRPTPSRNAEAMTRLGVAGGGRAR